MTLALSNTAFLIPGHQLSGISEGSVTSLLEYHFLGHLLSENRVAKPSNNRNALAIPALGTECWQALPWDGFLHLYLQFYYRSTKGESMNL